MWNKIDNETKIGGLFGIIAIIAIIFETFDSALDSTAIWAAIKDISSTMVAVMVFIIAIRSIPRKNKKSFEERLKDALNTWESQNSNMIVKSTDDHKTNKFGYSMRTDLNDFFRPFPLTKNVGWFVRMPFIEEENYRKEKVKIEFHLNKGTFIGTKAIDKNELASSFNTLIHLFTGFINKKHKDFAFASGKGDTIVVEFLDPIVTDQDIDGFISLLNSMLQAYLVAGNIVINKINPISKEVEED